MGEKEVSKDASELMWAVLLGVTRGLSANAILFFGRGTASNHHRKRKIAPRRIRHCPLPQHRKGRVLRLPQAPKQDILRGGDIQPNPGPGRQGVEDFQLRPVLVDLAIRTLGCPWPVVVEGWVRGGA